MEVVYQQLRGKFIEIDIEFIYTLGTMYLEILSAAMTDKFMNELRKK